MSKVLHKVMTFALGSALGLGAFTASVHAKEVAYPTQLVRIIVPFAAGGFTDAMARFYAQKLSEKWGQSVIVDNRPVGSGIIGTSVAAKADPDGHTLVFGNSSSLTIIDALGLQVPYNAAKDFTAITTLGQTKNLVVVKPDSPFQTLGDIVAAAKEKPGEVSYSSAQIGSGGHLLMSMLEQDAGVKFNHVPYKGSAPAMMATLSGEVTFSATSVAGALTQVKAGAVRPVVVAGDQRSEFLPDIPTFAEAGFPAVEAVKAWVGVLAPAGVPDAIVQKIYTGFKEISDTPEAKEVLRKYGQEADPSTPEEFAARLRGELKSYADVVKAANIVAQ